MIYFDNAATTMIKPPEVAEAITNALGSFGGVGRGVHPASLAAGRCVFSARRHVAELLGAENAACVSFTNNATMALNIALQGTIAPNAHIITTAASHNSILRPLFRLRDTQGCTIHIVPINEDGSLDFETYTELLNRYPISVVAITHASNLTGDIYDVARMAQQAHEASASVIVDAAQTAGAIPVSISKLGIDILCFTGHKSLFGPQGTGGLCVQPTVAIEPLLEGGSGTYTYSERHPRCMPEALEAGTINAHGIAGLDAGVCFVQKTGVKTIANATASLTARFESGLSGIPDVRILGRHTKHNTCGIVAFNVQGVDCAALADLLATDFGICTRAGAHCAPLMHTALGTKAIGAIRFSFGYFNSEQEIDIGLEAVDTCITRLRKAP